MRYTYPRPEFRSSRTFVANLLAFVLLASQFAPLAAAQGARGGARRQQPVKVKGGQPGGGEKVSPVTAAPLGAPAITATKVDSFPDANADGKADPGETITYTVTITNTGGDPATGVAFNDTVDANTTLVPGSVNTSPVVAADAYNVVGNVRIQPTAAQGLLANDIDPDTGNATGLTVTALAGDNTAPFAGTSAQGGQVTSPTADGAFAYNPAPGFAGVDTFSYTVSDGTATDTATVTLQVGNGTSTPGTNVIWFVDDSAAAGGDGRLTSPFNCYTGTNVPAVSTCFSNSALDEAGDSIFLYVGAYTGGHTLLNAQKLVGQGASDTLETIAGVTVPAYSDPLPQTNEPAGTNPTPPTITTTVAANGVNLAQNNVLRGFTVGNVPAANYKIGGTGFGQLTVGKAAEPDVSLGGTGRALQLVNGTLAATSGFGTVETTSGSGGASILLSQITAGALTFASTSVSGATGGGVEVNGSSADINFGNTTVNTGGTDGVVLANNPAGTRSFGTLSITGGSGIGFRHFDPDGGGAGVGGGAVSVAGAMTVTNPAGNGIDIQNSNANLSFAATTVNKGSTSNVGVNLVNNASRTIGFASLASTTTNGFALNTNASGTVNTGGGSLTQSGAGGGAAQLVNTTLGLNFTTVSSNGGANGVIINVGGGTFASGTTNLQNNAGVGLFVLSSTVAANFGNTTVNSSSGNAVDLQNNTGAITFADLDLTPDANLRGLSATGNTGAITSSSGDVVATGAPAVFINGPAGRTPLALVLNNVDSTNSTTQGFFLNLVSGNLTVNDATLATNIQNPTNNGIEVTNTGAGTISFGNTTVNQSGNANGDDAGTGVILTNNAGAVTFAALTVTPDSGERGLLANDTDATAAGAITVGSGTITTTNDTAVQIAGQAVGNRTPINIQLQTVSVTGGGVAANGIILTNTSTTGSPGGFRVLGTSAGLCGGQVTGVPATVTAPNAADCTGGTIIGATGAGILLTNASGVSFTRVRVADGGDDGITGSGVTALTLASSLIENNGNAVGEANLDIDDLHGSSSITNSAIRLAHENNIEVRNTTNDGALATLSVTGSTINNASAKTQSDDGVLYSASGTANMSITVSGCALFANRGDHLQAVLNDTADLVSNFTNNTLTGGHGTALGQDIVINTGNVSTGASFTYDINGNSINGAILSAITATLGTPSVGVTMSGRIRNNTIGTTGVPESGSVQANGITYNQTGGGTLVGAITGNTIRQWEQRGISASAFSTSGTLSLTIQSNTILEGNALDPVSQVGGREAIIVIAGSSAAGDTNTVCLEIGGAGALANNVNRGPEAVVSGENDIRVRARSASTFRLPGYAGSATDTTAVQNFIAARNTSSVDGVVTVSADKAATSAGFVGGAACQAPAGPITLNSAVAGETDSASASSQPAVAQPQPQPQQFILPVVAAQPQPAAPAVARVDTPVAAAAAAVKADKADAGKSAAELTKADRTRKSAAAPNGASPGTVSVNIGTLAPGDSVTITFQVTVNNPFPAGVTQVSNQGTVSGTNFSNVLTDDPSVAGTSNPTVTPVQGPPDINIRDASVSEPASGSSVMAFTVTLSAPSTNTVSVNFATADEPAGPGKAVAGVDYTTTSGTLTFAPGQTVQTASVPVLADADAAEPDETFLVNLSAPVNGNIIDGQAVGTITAANPAGTTLISELRTSGPGTLGTGDAADEFVEVYNNTDAAVTVAASDASPGWGLYKMGAACGDTPVLVGTIPNGTVIPARGHYLFIGTGYSLAGYSAGNLTLTAGIEDDRNVGLFNTADAANLATGTRLDAVGFGTNAGNNCDLLREGATLAAAGSVAQHTFVRNQTTGKPLDRNDNAGDFLVLSTTPGTAVGATATPRLGAPGPENLAGPINRSVSIKPGLVDPGALSSAAPNRVRVLTPDPANNSTFGTLAIRRKFTNMTGGALTRLRFRVIDITTAPVPAGTADLRVRTSSTSTVSLTGGGTAQVQGLTLETPPAQPNGGGWNSTVAAGTITVGTPLAAGASINVEFLLGLQQTGTFRFFIIVEAAPGGPPFGPEKLGPDAKGAGRDDSKDVPQN